ncbi:Oligosaccharyl transferase STT3 subunit [Ferroglobus placidus DSM 10642]|uniref:dolichyl-phosphooligosaccharide-protein glycotransferase n=1 Tax=Ferroglobus placidus (strain DSM 10642 / AEDII12DO) TaxID=589924 RepID=D3S254_FERPA|nr:oligosaccharyl transferase, archaeosortase A system-associated [Ferroglobus placidus]ADC66545.1 Oligosaccharyl transferase STT3 subunit [Ferroglobus placidus DSM 10642]
MSQKLERYWHVPFILLAIILALYIRIVNPWNLVFVPWMEGARLSGNDPWYYFRLVESTIHNFPNRIWFDAFTHYPYGTYTHFGPFLTYLSAFAAMIAGASSSAEIRTVIAFIPAIGGALLALPTYLLTKEVFGKKAGVIASILVVLIPGQLMARSVLSFNDHHIWEVFWQIAALGTFILAYNRWKSRDYGENIKDNKQLAYPILAGICMGLYILAWGPGFISALLILVFVFFAFLLKDFFKIDTKSLAFVSVIAFLVAAVIYLPFSFKAPGLSTTRYTAFQLLVLIGSALIVSLFYFVEKFVESKIDKRYAFQIIILLLSATLTAIAFIIAPDFARNLQYIFRVVQPKGGALTIAEVQPFFSLGGKFSLTPAWQNFSVTFFFAIPAMVYYLYRLVKTRDERLLFILIWGFAMLVALAGQNRFAYYFGVVSAVFAAAIADKILEKLSFYDYISAAVKNDEKTMKKIGASKVIAGALVLAVLIYPTFSQANFYSKYSAGGINKQWYDALIWMRENTPGKEMYDKFYYELYKPPENPRERYPYYPEGVYSVMSWWDYGHWITAIAHRIPVANPFQQGIGNKYNNVPGAAPFFTALNESYANSIAEKLDVKYVVSDVEMATGKFYAMAVWAEGTLEKGWRTYYAGTGIIYHDLRGNIGISLSPRLPPGVTPMGTISVPNENYYKTMEAKFHIFDGIGLKHYRMVYESESSAGTFPGIQELFYRKRFNSIYSKSFGFKVNETSTGYVKVFEYVKGAIVKGKASGDYVVAKVKIKTNQGRVFEYVQRVKVENGEYELVLPYAQETKYPVKPIEDYRIESGGVVKTLKLSDEELEKGEVIQLDLI